jgi:hypothetical protein
VRLLHYSGAARPLQERPAESIVREARALAARGVKEILLISQDTTFYGVDRQERGALARLLRALNGVDGLEWIRLLYLYPTTIDDGTLAAMAECEKVCKYIDLPLQHASNPVLKRMKRPGTRQKYDDLLPHPQPSPGRRPAHDLHRRLPGRNGWRSRRAVQVSFATRRSTMSACDALPRRGHVSHTPSTTTCRPE